MMKKRMLLLLAAAILVLTACGNKIGTGGQPGTQAGNGQKAAQTIQGQTQAGAPSSDQAGGQQDAEGDEEDAPEDQDDQDEGSIWEEENYDGGDPGGTGGEDEGDEADEDSAEGVIEEEQENAGSAAAVWDGSYMCDNGETLHVQASEDGSSVQFSFAAAGISGTAQLKGNEAVYHGDDLVDVVFSLSGEGINVTVQSQEDYGEIKSAVSGYYSMANP